MKNGIIESDTVLSQENTMNYIVSTVQYNALVNKTLLLNVLKFADAHNVSKIYLFVMAGKNIHEDVIHPLLFEDDRIEFITPDKSGTKLNSNLKLYDTGILASQINPLTGMNFKLHRDFSYILPSPKIRYLSIPNTSKYPRFLATTGALTHGNYKLHTAQGRKAELMHEYGFAFIEVVNGRLFNYHPVMALKNGTFNYNREAYKATKVIDEQPEALILGDWHVGDTCIKTRKATLKMIKALKPKRVFFHDFFNGHSINRHETNNHLSKARLWQNKMCVLEQEIKECLNELVSITDMFPDVEFFVVESNHDLFLSRYIGEENFLEDGQNSVFACKLFVGVSDSTNQVPMLERAMGLVGEIPKNVRFLNEDEEYRVKGVGLDYHGHRGMNGARGSGASFDRHNLKLITGHTHSPAIYANGMTVGTSTLLRLPYTKGASSWLNAHGLLYKSGKYTLLTLIF